METHPLRILIKALSLFVALNIIYALIDPPISKISAYNTIFPGRVRMPFGNDADPFAVMVDDVDVMFASHSVSDKKITKEYRVVLIGDSSIWGENLAAQDSISVLWNAKDMQCGDRSVKIYNLGYPHPSVIKDLVILDKAMEYDPDFVVWFVTLNTLIPRRLSPFLAANHERAVRVLDTYDIPFVQEDALLASETTFFQKTLVGQRSRLARLIKLQVLGAVWAATGADMKTPLASDAVLSPDVDGDDQYRGMKPASDLNKMMLFDAIKAGRDITGSTPILIINEPMFIADGVNKDIRYNDFYPRWAYDQYRKSLNAAALTSQWNYLDLWNAIPSEYFSDTPLHLSAQGEQLLIEQIIPVLNSFVCN